MNQNSPRTNLKKTLCIPIMSDNKLVKSILDAATITGVVAGIGWIGRKIIKEDLTKDPSANAMNYIKFTAVMAGSIALRSISRTRRYFQPMCELTRSLSSYCLTTTHIHNGECRYHGWRGRPQRGHFHRRQLSSEVFVRRQWPGCAG